LLGLIVLNMTQDCDHCSLTSSISASRSAQLLETELSLWLGEQSTA